MTHGTTTSNDNHSEVVMVSEVANVSIDNSPTLEVSVLAGDVENDLGYEYCEPTRRRGSMSVSTEKERRASIQAVMADATLSPTTKRRSIQHLMDGRRYSAAGDRRGSIASSVADESHTGYSGSNISSHTDHELDLPWAFSGSKIVPVCNEQTRRAEKMRPHCPHYERNCTMIAPCCGAAFGCRICHDDCATLPPKIRPGIKRYNRSASLPGSFTDRTMTVINNRTTPSDSSDIPEDNHHLIDRHAVVEVICRVCCTRQSSKTNTCTNCGVKFGEYHCSICNLWMSDEERPYHCADCGFCRVGGQENFQHCDQCGMCIDRVVFSDHNCKADKYRSNCPVCQEYLFSSRAASHEMPCGHAIHWDCFRQLATHDSRCPFCKKTAETMDRMMPIWDEMTECIALQPVPPELARVVNITCIDCECTEKDIAWHFLGVRCHQCSSFNTVVDKIVMQGQEAHEFLKQNLSSERRRKNRLKPTPSSRSDRSNEENPVNRRRSIL